MANISEPDWAEAAARDYRRNRRNIWVWCLTLSLALHLVLLGAWPGSMATRNTLKARALDVALMPETLVPALAPRSTPPRRTDNTAKINKAQVRRERMPEPRPTPDAGLRTTQAIAADKSVPVPEPLAAASIPAKPNDAYSAIASESRNAMPGRSANDVVAPSIHAAHLRNPVPQYPLVARRNGEQGTVTLKVRVTREGMPASVSVDQTSGFAHLDLAALETVRAWRFAPARQGTQPVEAWVLVPIVFRLEPVP